MRALFNDNLKKLRSSNKSGAGSDDIYTPTFKHFDALTFLLDQDEPRDGVSSLVIVKEPSSDVFRFNQNKENIPTNVANARKAQNTTRTTPDKIDELMERAVKHLEESSNTTPAYITSRLMVIESHFLKLPKDDLNSKFIEILNVLSH